MAGVFLRLNIIIGRENNAKKQLARIDGMEFEMIKGGGCGKKHGGKPLKN
jgi:hypothetical protein